MIALFLSLLALTLVIDSATQLLVVLTSHMSGKAVGYTSHFIPFNSLQLATGLLLLEQAR